MKDSLSIIIVNWNTKDYLRACLVSIYAEVQNLELEVIVIDNASSDGSPEMVMQEFPQAKLIRNEENVGFGAANNQGFKVAKSQYLLMLNSDTKVLTDLSPLLGKLKARPDVGLLGCKILNDDGTIQLLCARPFPTIGNKLINYIRIGFPFMTKWLGRQDGYSDWDYNDEREVEVISGAFMIFRRNLPEIIGDLDDKTFFMYGEDIDWCKKVHLANLRILYSPAATILHYGNKSSIQIAGPTGFLRVQSLARYFDRYHGWGYGLWFRSLVFMTAFIGWLPVALLRALRGSQHYKTASKVNQVYEIFSRVLSDPLLSKKAL